MAEQEQELDGFAVAVVRDTGGWRVQPMRPAALASLDAAVTELRELRSAGAAFGLLDVDEEFFVVVRPGPRGVALVISDATAAWDYDLAGEVLESLHVEVPDEDDDDVESYSEGELDLLADLGLPGPVLNIILDEDELYPDEQLAMIAERCGFAEELAAAVEALGG